MSTAVVDESDKFSNLSNWKEELRQLENLL